MAQLHIRPATHEDLPILIAMLADDFLGKERGDHISQDLAHS